MAQNRRLIDADDLISEIRDDPNVNGAHFARVKQHIENASTVDDEPVRHGRWIWNKKVNYYICPCCKSSALNNYRMLSTASPFCPHCGANMDLGGA